MIKIEGEQGQMVKAATQTLAPRQNASGLELVQEHRVGQVVWIYATGRIRPAIISRGTVRGGTKIKVLHSTPATLAENGQRTREVWGFEKTVDLSDVYVTKGR